MGWFVNNFPIFFSISYILDLVGFNISLNGVSNPFCIYVGSS